MRLPKPRGVIFDFGDTLMREGPVDYRAGAAAVLQLASDANGCTAEQLANAHETLTADLNPRRRASQLELPPHTVWRLIYDPLGIRFSVDPSEVEWAFWHAATTWTMEPGVLQPLELLRQKGVPCGVLSNTMFRGITISRHLTANGFGDAFQWVMASTDFVLRKPHPRLFDLAAQRMGESPGDLWFIGDSFELDVIGATAAGMVPIWYCTSGNAGTTSDPAAYVLTNWSQLPELLAMADDAAGRSNHP
jgi:putative hydrolase of the HAD superfamily